MAVSLRVYFLPPLWPQQLNLRNAVGVTYPRPHLKGAAVLARRGVSLQTGRILATADNPGPAIEIAEVRRRRRALGLEVAAPDVRRSQDLAPALNGLKGRVEALYVVTDPLMNTNRTEISALALAAHLPTMHGRRDKLEIGRPDVLRAELA